MARKYTDNLNMDKELPYDLETERAILSLCLKNSEAVDITAGKKLSADNFYSNENKTIFASVLRLFLDGKNVDAYTVSEDLSSHAELEKAGGQAYILGLADSVASLASIDYYIDIVSEKSRKRTLIQKLQELTEITYENKDSVNGIVDSAISQLADMKVDNEGIGFEPIGDILKNNIREIHAVQTGQMDRTGIPTGFTRLDQYLGGLRPGTLHIIAGRPGMGKTAFVLNIATNIVINVNKPVDIFSLEMSKSEIGNRILASRSDTTSKDLQRANLSETKLLEVSRAVNDLKSLPLYIDDKSSVNPASMMAKCKELKSQNRLGVVIVDYLQLMTMGKSAGNYSRQQEVSDISRSLKILAKDLGVPVIALSQLSRGSVQRDDHTPQLADLRDSGAIEQDADSVIFIDRDDYYSAEKRSEDIQDAKIIVAKNRHGQTGTIKLKWRGSKTLFYQEDDKSDPVDPMAGRSSAYTAVQSADAAAGSYSYEEEPPVSSDIPEPEPPPAEDNDAFFAQDEINTDFPADLFGGV